MNVSHGPSGCSHGIQCLLIDVRSLDTVYLLLDLGNLVIGLLETALMYLLPTKSSFGS